MLPAGSSGGTLPVQQLNAVTPEVVLPAGTATLNPWAPLLNTLLTALFMFWGFRLDSELKQLRGELRRETKGARKDMKRLRRDLHTQMKALDGGQQALLRQCDRTGYGLAGIAVLLVSPALVEKVARLLGITP
ncbi:hypothetical protein COHA_000287 [Chlorella ohadii]|uniref:Uncharacterized protein n=1 Tax=Chlorella ohadii TaxID=2649997 RepID=A0AAD5HA33_9CHLO|nr:hypothetical protein COHA_000287 [Chlorella ohadii]